MSPFMVPATQVARSPCYTTIALLKVIDPRFCTYQKIDFLQMMQGVSPLVINDHVTC